jgi:hypothetical protein
VFALVKGGSPMARRNLSVHVTGEQRKRIDPHQIAQILLDLIAMEADDTDPDAAKRPDHVVRHDNAKGKHS